MDGETALQYVRSRHAQGDEGTDFARSRRQEKVIASFKDKVFALETILNPVKVIGLYSTLKDSVDTNILEEEIDDFIKLAQKMGKANIYSATIDYGNEKEKRSGLLVNPSISNEYGNQWVLIPRIGNGNFSEIQKYVECEIKVGNCPIAN
jgi:anionic cell wall polymer biosynthesis LytR-Cps2A-Psr (LCP) family protein